MQRSVCIVAIAGLIAVAAAANAEGGVRLAAAAVIGAGGGLVLYHAAFGFAGAWRRLLHERRGAGVRAQMLLLAAASTVTFPLIAYGEGWGLAAAGWVFPIGLGSAIGAALFGIGMQLGGGCGSGVLFAAGGGSARMLVTLAAFVAGSVLWTGTHGLWRGLPRGPSVSLIEGLGPWAALALSLALFAAIAGAASLLERRRHGGLEAPRCTRGLLRGPWSLSLGALALAAVVIATFLALGRPWGITSAFPLWGVKALDALGAPIGAWNGWSDQRIAQPVFGHATSVMNFGVMLGALAAAGLAGRFAPSARLSAKDVLTAAVGGLMMGYGARLAYGCNIGGFVGGVVSGSLHGWWWLIFGFLGSGIGVWLRARLGMDGALSARSAGA